MISFQTGDTVRCAGFGKQYKKGLINYGGNHVYYMVMFNNSLIIDIHFKDLALTRMVLTEKYIKEKK